MTISCCSDFNKCYISAYTIDRVGQCHDKPLVWGNWICCRETPRPGFCTDCSKSGMTRFQCCNGLLIRTNRVNDGITDCGHMGEDERVVIRDCADVEDIHDTRFNFVAIPVIILAILAACCYKARKGRRRNEETNEENNAGQADHCHQTASASAVDLGPALDQTGPGWVVGSEPGWVVGRDPPPPPQSHSGAPESGSPAPATPLAPPPYSPSLNAADTVYHPQFMAPPPSYEEAVQMKK